jgi:hypothetical protein
VIRRLAAHGQRDLGQALGALLRTANGMLVRRAIPTVERGA